jgi:hypothetical protein
VNECVDYWGIREFHLSVDGAIYRPLAKKTKVGLVDVRRRECRFNNKVCSSATTELNWAGSAKQFLKEQATITTIIINTTTITIMIVIIIIMIIPTIIIEILIITTIIATCFQFKDELCISTTMSLSK